MARLYGVHHIRSLPARHVAALAAVMVRQPESWTHRAIQPDWQWESHLAALAAHQADSLATLVWQNTKDGHKGRNQPKPYPRPGVDGYHTPGQAGSDWQVASVEEVARRLGITTTP